MYENLIFQDMLGQYTHLQWKHSCHAYCLLLSLLEILHKKIVGSVLRQVDGISCSVKVKQICSSILHLFFCVIILIKLCSKNYIGVKAVVAAKNPTSIHHSPAHQGTELI
jgi:hypothetical protein